MSAVPTPAAKPTERVRPDWLTLLVLGIIGSIVGLIACESALAAIGDVVGVPAPQCGFHTIVITPAQSGADSTLDVTLFDRILIYSRSESDPAAFDLEVAFWNWLLPVLDVIAGAITGVYVGRLVSRRLRSRRGEVGVS